MAAFRNSGWPETTFTSLTLPSKPIIAVRTTSPCAPACLAIEGYSGSLRTSNWACWTCPPLVPFLAVFAAWAGVLCGAAAGGAEIDGGGGMLFTPTGTDVDTTSPPRPMSGASGKSVGRTGRNLCESESLLNGFAGVGLGRTSAWAANSSPDTESGAPASLEAPVGLAGLGAGAVFEPCASCPGSGMGDGRVRNTRTDSLVVFVWSAPV